MKFFNIFSFIAIAFTLLNCNSSIKNTETSKSDINHIDAGVQPVAENILSQFTNIRDFTIDTEESEAYFTVLSPLSELSVIMKIVREDNRWNQPKISSFSGKFTDLEPFLSPDNLRLYFASNRPTSNNSTATKDFDIWYVERTNKTSSWSQPINLGPPINTSSDEFYPSIALSKNLYFTSVKENSESQDDIYVSRWENNTYSNPIKLDSTINSDGSEFNAFIAPDESYLLFSGWKRKDGVGSGDLYISKQNNGKWTQAKNLSDKINSKHIDYSPFVNQNTKILYFTSRRSTISNHDTGFVDTQSLLNVLNKYENGSSRIYKVNFSEIFEQN
ncbi:TolB-like translocation protein [Winogradskyella bathintestinalis]|uniref:Exo-alpha-sialidase n=1 Tax=Winogradskyella bathintestinalis TaxID=3035208 RepID=A0ABT7ZRJ9_9FLAO|nr:hypothetical protein [Winogradskyella bathintestinalis]MDN3491439.1 hypothetical protein [Winogradskyella bathintestinalis]